MVVTFFYYLISESSSGCSQSETLDLLTDRLRQGPCDSAQLVDYIKPTCGNISDFDCVGSKIPNITIFST